MQLFLSFMLVISFATFQFAFGDDNKLDSLTDGSKQDQEVAEFEAMENDDALDDDAVDEEVAEFEAMENDDALDDDAVDEEVAEFEAMENDDELDDDAEYRWLAPEMFDETQKRALAVRQEKAQELQKIKGGGKKNKNANKNNNKPKKKFKNKEMKLWVDTLGCYKDKGVRAWTDPSIRAIETLFKNLRRPGRINWGWGDYLEVIMQCAQAAQARGYACFGIEFYGECWGSNNACDTYVRYGNSSKCIKGVGLHWALYVYKAKCGSVYGCCPDGAMPANGTNYEGCPDCTTAVDLVFVVDSSGSIGEKNFKTVKIVLDKLIRHFSVSASNARIGIVQYATNARVIYTLAKSQRLGFHRLAKRVRGLFYTKGATKTGKGLLLANRMLRHSKRKLNGKFLKHEQVVVVLTDGLTNNDDVARFRLSSTALKAVSRVVAVGVAGKGYTNAKQRQQRAELDQIASSRKDRFFKVSFKDLYDHVGQIARRACPIY